MNTLEHLKTCKTLHDLAVLLGYKTKALSFILYSKPIHSQYEIFTIPKKNGGLRTIHSPKKDLKELQKKLAAILNDCFNIIELERLTTSSYIKCIISHGFRQKLTVELPVNKNNRKKLKTFDLNLGIYSNAKRHINRKYVLNIDLKDFFHSITFRRIVGYFCKNDHFKLDKNISILISQICTYRDPNLTEGYLPQGSPCSPIISNFIGGILDNRLNNFAQENKCSYSRFADDITFSTNMKFFPKNIAFEENEKYILGKPLRKIIKNSHFFINNKKTRLTTHQNKQEVTGLVVNKKVNISNNYNQYTRSMVHSFCSTGSFSRSKYHVNSNLVTINSLNGILNHVFNIKFPLYKPNVKLRNFDDLQGVEKLLIQFSFHKEFIFNEKPHIICEGVTDPLHLKYAYKQLHSTNNYPFKFSSLEEIHIFSKILGLGNGTPNMIKFLNMYHKIKKSKANSANACIFFVDGDNDGKSVITNTLKKFKNYEKIDFANYKNSIDLLETYHLEENLYIVQLPKEEMIENLYPQSILNIQLGSRAYNGSNDKFDKKQFYGKIEFINEIIKNPNNKVDFSKFYIVFDTLAHIQIHNYLKNI